VNTLRRNCWLIFIGLIVIVGQLYSGITNHNTIKYLQAELVAAKTHLVLNRIDVTDKNGAPASLMAMNVMLKALRNAQQDDIERVFGETVYLDDAEIVVGPRLGAYPIIVFDQDPNDEWEISWTNEGGRTIFREVPSRPTNCE